MPRAFLITHRRYDGPEEFEDAREEFSPDRRSQVVEYRNCQPTSDGASDCGSETSSECPEELYNLTKLAEVSLAAAAGTLIHPNNTSYQHQPLSSSSFCEYRMPESESPRFQPHLQEQKLRGSARFLFERIESEGEILEERDQLPSKTTYNSELNRRVSIITTETPETPRTSRISPTTVSRRIEGVKNEDSGEDHECPDCGKKYSTSSNLARHRQTHRSLGDKKARRCPHCDKVYVSIPAFSMHVRTHNQGCKCHYCGKCFSRPWLLQGHIRTHTGEKPFKCTICNKAFADKSNLRAHIQTHSNTKPHICSRCGKAFALKSYLYKHEESSCMRTHRATPDKRESIELLASPVPSNAPLVTASPTSVIVPRNLAFPAIIRQAKSSSETEQESVEKAMAEKKYLSTMVIRTSVISPNPEHLSNRVDRASFSRSSGLKIAIA